MNRPARTPRPYRIVLPSGSRRPPGRRQQADREGRGSFFGAPGGISSSRPGPPRRGAPGDQTSPGELRGNRSNDTHPRTSPPVLYHCLMKYGFRGPVWVLCWVPLEGPVRGDVVIPRGGVGGGFDAASSRRTRNAARGSPSGAPAGAQGGPRRREKGRAPGRQGLKWEGEKGPDVRD